MRVEQSRCLEDPTAKWITLKERVQDEAVKQFKTVETDWLALMWCLDSHRMQGSTPEGVKDIDTLNRRKGNWFAELIALLLQNRTDQHIGARTKVQGFSQPHQIDVAWPARQNDVLVCVETKVTGAPPSPTKPARAATGDWTNRRKELKFAATDLKLYRRQQETTIDHWDVWRKDNPPKTFFLWAARIEPKKDSLAHMTKEIRAIVETYLDGAGLVAWGQTKDGSGYQALELPVSDRLAVLDDVLHRIANEITRLSGPDGKPPDPITPSRSITLGEGV